MRRSLLAVADSCRGGARRSCPGSSTVVLPGELGRCACGLVLAAGAVLRGLRSAQPATALLVAALATIPVEDGPFGGSLFMWVALAGALLTGSGDRERRRPE